MDYVGGWAGVNPDPDEVRTLSICSLVLWPQVGYLWIYIQFPDSLNNCFLPF